MPFVKGYKPWNAGLKGDSRCSKVGVDCRSSGMGATPEKEVERKRKIKEASKNNGGYRQGSGRGKKGWYKGFYCDSSYELAYIVYCIDNGITIERNRQERTYEWEGKIRKYIPDFIVDGKVTEIKGYRSPQWEAKLRANQDVRVLYEKDLADVFQYVVTKYGKDFIQLYGG